MCSLRNRTMTRRRPTSSASRGSAIDPRTRTAFHEAGHAVLGAALNDRPHHVSIRGRDGTLGRTSQRRAASATSLAQVLLAGFAAEHARYGRRPKSYDIETGLGILAHTDHSLVEKIEGVEGSDGYGAIHELLRTGVRAEEDDLRREVDRIYEITRECVAVLWPAVKALAKALLVHEEMDRDAIDEVIGPHDIYIPVFRIQRVHGLLPDTVPPSPSIQEESVAAASMLPTRTRLNKKSPEPASNSSKTTDPRIERLLSALRKEGKLARVVAAYEREASKPGRKFGKNGLKTKDGKLFALFTQGTLVVKLPRERVAALVAKGVGAPFDPGHGRLMKEWLTVTSAKASWVNLANEAHDFVSGEAGK